MSMHYLYSLNEIFIMSGQKCDWICKKGSYMCNYKYLEIPF